MQQGNSASTSSPDPVLVTLPGLLAIASSRSRPIHFPVFALLTTGALRQCWYSQTPPAVDPSTLTPAFFYPTYPATQLFILTLSIPLMAFALHSLVWLLSLILDHYLIPPKKACNYTPRLPAWTKFWVYVGIKGSGVVVAAVGVVVVVVSLCVVSPNVVDVLFLSAPGHY